MPRGRRGHWLFALLAVLILSAEPALASGIGWATLDPGATWAPYFGFGQVQYDNLKHRVLVFSIENGSSSNYASTLWAYPVGATDFTRLGGAVDNSSQSLMVSTCQQGKNVPPTTPPGQIWSDDTPTWPGPRDYDRQLTWDDLRKGLWLMGGACAGNQYNDTYFFDSATDTWKQISTTVQPIYPVTRALIHDWEHDVLLVYGTDGGAQIHHHYVFCPTDRNPTPGVVTPVQAQAGCAVPDDWNEIFPAAPNPSAVTDTGLVYDGLTHKVLLYGGSDTQVRNETWAYDVPTQTWTNLNPASPPPLPVFWDGPSLAYDSRAGLMLYHHWSGADAPSDWAYNPRDNSWTRYGGGTGFVGTHTGPVNSMVYDPDDDLLVSWSTSGGPGSDVALGRPDFSSSGMTGISDAGVPIDFGPFGRGPYSVGCGCEAGASASPLWLFGLLWSACLRRARQLV